MNLADKLIKGKPAPKPKARPAGPVWKGPEEDGVTFSLLSRFLVCRERFRLLVVEGLRPSDQWDHRSGYGNMWHACEEAFASGQEVTKPNGLGVDNYWEVALKAYCVDLVKRYPTAQEDIAKWYEVCKIQFPLYVDYWREHEDVTHRTPIEQEYTFDVRYKLPSGRVVRLRGKRDSVDLIGDRKPAIYVQENKTKGDIREGQLKRQLTFDLQTMLYLVSVIEDQRVGADALANYPAKKYPVAGVRYNVVRRPLSGGKGNIKQLGPTKARPQGESKAEYHARLRQYIVDEPETYFMRWRVEVSPQDVAKFRRECLDPVLESLCEWWNWVTSKEVADKGIYHDGAGWGVHYRYPFGVRNPLIEGGSSDLDEHLASGSEIGLKRTSNLFPELT